MAQPLELRLRITGDGSGLSATVRDAEGNIVRLGQAGGNAGRQINAGFSSARAGVASISAQLAQMRNVAVGLAGMSFGGGGLKALVSDAAAYQDLQTRLRSLTQDSADYAQVQVYLADVARGHHKDINTLSDSYARLRTLQNSGLLTDQQSKQMLEGMSNAASALGANNAQLGQSFYGLSQALSSGVVRAEEFNQVIEPLPGLMQRLDDALGQGAGAFRVLVNEGRMTSEMFSDYLVKALRSYDGAAAASGKNINATFVDLKNEYTGLVAELESPIASALLPMVRELAQILRRDLVPLAKEFKAIDFTGTGAGAAVLAGGLAGAKLGASLPLPPALKGYAGAGGLVLGSMAAYVGVTDAGPRPDLTPADLTAASLREKIRLADAYVTRLEKDAIAGLTNPNLTAQAIGATAQDTLLLQEQLVQVLAAQLQPLGADYSEAAAGIKALLDSVRTQVAAEPTPQGRAALAREPAAITAALLVKMEKTLAELQPKAAPEATTLALIRTAAQKHHIPENLLRAVVNIESGARQFDTQGKTVTSPAGAVGIAQIVPKWHPAFDPERLKTDTAYNLDAGATYLAQLQQIFQGDLPKVIAAYNAGQGAVQKRGLEGVLSPSFGEGETAAYVPKVLKELDRLNLTRETTTLEADLKNRLVLSASQREAAFIRTESQIDTRLNTTKTLAETVIEELKIAKERGEMGIKEYYRELTRQQETVVKAQIEAAQQKITQIEQQAEADRLTTKPENLPKITAQAAAQKAALSVDLSGFEGQLKTIGPANLLDRDRELAELDAVVGGVRAKLAELRGEAAADPIAIRARLEIEHAKNLADLRQAGQGGLGEEFLGALSGAEQGQALQAEFNRVQQRTGAEQQRINLLQQAGATSQTYAQQALRDLYQESAAELDAIADKMQALGDKTGLKSLKTQALDAKNAALQLRTALPGLGQRLINEGQVAAIDGLATGLINLSNGAQSAGNAFQSMALSIVGALQQIAAEEFARQVIGAVFNVAGIAAGGFGGFGGSAAPAGPTPGGLSGQISTAITPSFATPSFATGGLIKGPGSGTSDSIATTLPAGSFVLTASSTQAVGAPVLDALLGLAGAMPGGIATGKAGGAYPTTDGPRVPVRVSNGEYQVPPAAVAALGVAFFERINRTGAVPGVPRPDLAAIRRLAAYPPGRVQRAYAQGGLVNGQTAATAAPAAQNTLAQPVTVNVPVTVVEAEPSGGGNRPDAGNLAAFANDLQATVDTRVAHHLRPGGLLFRG